MSESPRERLERVLGASGVDLTDIASLFDFVKAPESLKGLWQVAQNLIRILPLVERIAGLAGNRSLQETSRTWLRVASSIQSVEKQLSSVIPDFSVVFVRGKQPPLWGEYDYHPLYVALSYECNSEASLPLWSHLFAHILVAFKILRDQAASEKNPSLAESSMETALLDVRKFAHNPASLKAYPTGLLSHELYRDAMQGLKDKAANNLYVVFRYSTGLRHAYTQDRSRGEPEEKRYFEPVRIARALDPDQIASNKVASSRVTKVPNKLLKDAKNLQGCSKHEFDAGFEYITTSFPGDQPMAGRTADQHKRRNRGVKSHIAMQNQRLANRWEELTGFEVETFLDAAGQLIGKGNSSFTCSKKARSGKVSDLELGTLLLTMFWLSQPLESAVRFRLYTSRPRPNDPAPGYVFLGQETAGFWLIRPTKPDVELLPIIGSHAQEIRETFHLPVHESLAGPLNDYLSKVKAVLKRKSGWLFRRNAEEYEEPISAFLHLVNAAASTRLTGKRISDHLYHLLARQEGSDLCQTMMITARTDHLATNPLHYTALPVSMLLKNYRRVCDTIERRAGVNQTSMSADSSKGVISPNGHVGSRLRPRQESITRLVTRVQDELTTAVKAARKPTAENLLALHNSMTRYTVLMLGYCTGYRGVRNPFTTFDQFDLESGFVVISDKDYIDHYNARIVWLPEMCVTQMRYYLDHLKHFTVKLQHLSPDLYREVQEQRDFDGKPTVPPFFYLTTRTRSKRDIQPKFIMSRLHDIYSLPMNTNRHHLRSSLVELECPAEVISAFMGHWERGEEPWGKYSALSPLTYKTVLGHHLEELLKRDGWKPIRGMGGDR